MRFIESWDGASVAIYIGCFIICMLVWRVLEAEKRIEKRLGALEEVAARHSGKNPGYRAEHSPCHCSDDPVARRERLSII